MREISQKTFHWYDVWTDVVVLLRAHPSVAVPFFLWGIADLVLLLGVVVLPGSLVVPLHGIFYDTARLFLASRFFSFARDIAGLLAGVVCIGTAVAMMAQALDGKRPAWSTGVRKVARRYTRYVAAGGLTLLATIVVVRLAGAVAVPGSAGTVAGVLGFCAAAVTQMLFVYAFPAIVIENRKVNAALRRSVGLFNRYRLATTLLVGVPYALAAPFAFVSYDLDALAQRFSPSAVLYLLVFRALGLAMINCFVTASATVLLLRQRQTAH